MENPELVLAKRQELELLSQKLKLMKSFGLSFYRPHEKQDAFHRAAGYKHRLWESGNRSGKSTGGVAEDCSFLLGYRPFYSESDPARTVGIPQGRPLRGLVVCNDWKKVGEVFTSRRGEEGKIWRFLPPGFVKDTKSNHEGVIDKIECENGSLLNFTCVSAWKSNPGSVESVDYDFAHFDEPLPKAMYTGVARGLVDRDGSDWFTLTPKAEPWIHSEFFPARKSKEKLFVVGRKWAQRGSTYDNPHLKAEGRDDWIKSLSRDQVECLIEGIPMQLAGLVYKEFNYDVHVLEKPLRGWNALDQPPPEATIYVAMDVHPQTPHHVMFVALLPHNVSVIYDEIFLACGTAELARLVLAKIANRFCVRIICDPLAFITHPVSGLSMADDFAANGLYVSKASKARSQGILLGKEWLSRPNAFFVSQHCEETVNEFSNHAWDEKANKPRDEDDHAMENFGRLAIERPVWLDQETMKYNAVEPITFNTTDLGELPDLDFNHSEY
jgi:hypothetical protein